MSNNKPKILDLFCGVGGFSLGFEMAGFETIFAIDQWNDAVTTYNRNRENPVAICDNIENFDSEKITNIKNKYEIDGIIGGPPCQGFSTVGTRDIGDPRNHLYLEYCRVVKEFEPRFFVIENVKGLLTLNSGMFKDDILERFGKLGYTISWKILNADDYGVPQQRQRVFFVGVKDGKFEFPQPVNHKVSTYEALSDLPPLDQRDIFEESYEYMYEPSSSYQALMRQNSDKIYNHNHTNHTQQTIDVISKIKDGGKISDLPKEYWEIRKYNKSFQRMNSQQPSHTIDTGHRNYFHYKENRIPSVRESARIQSFPDKFIFEGSKTSQYKQVGNAVPPLLSYHIASQLINKVKLTNNFKDIDIQIKEDYTQLSMRL